jgi:sulfur dioxygenase
METTVGEQKRRNPRLTKPKAEFCEIMKNLGLPYPKKLGACVCVCVVF